jgi:hypothetical protein
LADPRPPLIAAYFSFGLVTVAHTATTHDCRVNAGISQLLIPLIEFRMVAVVRAAWQRQTKRHACSNQKDFHFFSLMLAPADKD